jgi:hypothetical protein
MGNKLVIPHKITGEIICEVERNKYGIFDLSCLNLKNANLKGVNLKYSNEKMKGCA